MVRRGEILLDRDLWSNEPAKINEGKVRKQISRIFFVMFAVVHAYHRELEGFARALIRYLDVLNALAYTNLA